MPEPTSKLTQTLAGIKRMLAQFPYWDVSWVTAVTFFLGSLIWILNGFFVWLPKVAPDSEFEHEVVVAGGVTFSLGRWFLKSRACF